MQPAGAPSVLTGRAVSDGFGSMDSCCEWMTLAQISSEGALTGNAVTENRDVHAGRHLPERSGRGRRPRTAGGTGMMPAMEHDLASRRWLILASTVVSFFAVGVTFFAVPALVPELVSRFGLSHLAIGVLMGAISVPAVFFSIPLGAAVDRWPARAAGNAALLLMALGAVLFAIAPELRGPFRWQTPVWRRRPDHQPPARSPRHRRLCRTRAVVGDGDLQRGLSGEHDRHVHLSPATSRLLRVARRADGAGRRGPYRDSLSTTSRSPKTSAAKPPPRITAANRGSPSRWWRWRSPGCSSSPPMRRSSPSPPSGPGAVLRPCSSAVSSPGSRSF